MSVHAVAIHRIISKWAGVPSINYHVIFPYAYKEISAKFKLGILPMKTEAV